MKRTAWEIIAVLEFGIALGLCGELADLCAEVKFSIDISAGTTILCMIAGGVFGCAVSSIPLKRNSYD